MIQGMPEKQVRACEDAGGVQPIHAYIKISNDVRKKTLMICEKRRPKGGGLSKVQGPEWVSIQYYEPMGGGGRWVLSCSSTVARREKHNAVVIR